MDVLTLFSAKKDGVHVGGDDGSSNDDTMMDEDVYMDLKMMKKICL